MLAIIWLINYLIILCDQTLPLLVGCLKLNVDVGFKEGETTIAILAREEAGQVKGLWFEKVKVSSILTVETRAIYNVYLITHDQSYLKILIKSDCKVIIDGILGYSTYLWSINAIVEDIKVFSEW